MWELDYKESWVLKNWCFELWCGEDSWDSLGLQEIQPVHPKGNQSWIFIGRTDAEAETTILWPSDAENWLIWKDPDAGKDWGWEGKRMTEDEMVGWHHQFNRHELGQTPGDRELVRDKKAMGCCSPWCLEELDKTWGMNNNKNANRPHIIYFTIPHFKFLN